MPRRVRSSTRVELLSTRVEAPPTQVPRISLPYFHNPSLEVVVRPVVDAASLKWARPPPEDVSDTNCQTNNRAHAAYGLNAFKSLARSHPKVFARHHPDLTVGADGAIVVKSL